VGAIGAFIGACRRGCQQEQGCGRAGLSQLVKEGGKAQAVLSEPELLRAMFDVGCFPRTRRRLID
jgi:hypothetical protein